MEEVRVSENANQIPPEFVADGTMPAIFITAIA